MISTVTHDTLVRTFGADAVVRLPEQAQAPELSHVPTRAFLADVGLPLVEGALFEVVEDLGGGLTPLLDEYGEEELAAFGLGPDTVRHWFFLGEAAWSALALDGASGRVLALHGELGEAEPVHTDLSGMAYAMQVLATRRPEFTTKGGANQDLEAVRRAAAEVRREISEADPLPFARSEGLWHAVIEDICGGMW